MSKRIVEQETVPVVFYWRLTGGCSAHMLGLFRNKTKMYDRLNTNAVTWNTMTKGKGISKEKVVEIVKNFFDVLNKQRAARFVGDQDIYGFVAENTYPIYSTNISKEQYDQFVEVARSTTGDTQT